MPGTNSLAYFAAASVTKKKKFTRLTPDGDVFTGEMKSKFGTLKNWNFEEKKICSKRLSVKKVRECIKV